MMKKRKRVAQSVIDNVRALDEYVFRLMKEQDKQAADDHHHDHVLRDDEQRRVSDNGRRLALEALAQTRKKPNTGGY